MTTARYTEAELLVRLFAAGAAGTGEVELAACLARTHDPREAALLRRALRR